MYNSFINSYLQCLITHMPLTNVPLWSRINILKTLLAYNGDSRRWCEWRSAFLNTLISLLGFFFSIVNAKYFLTFCHNYTISTYSIFHFWYFETVFKSETVAIFFVFCCKLFHNVIVVGTKLLRKRCHSCNWNAVGQVIVQHM